MPIVIKKYLNTSQTIVDDKKYNIVIGISLGNKYFSKENIREYIVWALEHTKKDVLVVVADAIQSVNYEAFNEYSPTRAIAVAKRKGEEIIKIIEEVIYALSKKQRDLIRVITWKDVINPAWYQDNLKFIREEFETNPKFYDFIMSIIQENRPATFFKLSELQLKKAAEYVIGELPMLISGVDFGGKIYDLLPYPGLGKIDELAVGLQDGTLFPELTMKLVINNKMAVLEA